MVYKRPHTKYIVQPKKQCEDFDSDCLLVENHLACWAYQKEKGHCPYLQNKDYLIIKELKDE